MGTGLKMRRSASVLILLILLVSLFLLSVLSNVLTGYPKPARLPETEKERTGRETEKEPSVLLFKVSPVTPQLYWRVWSADYYTGRNWLRTTDEKVLEELPQTQDTNATRVFTVEVNSSQREIFLPLASANSTSANISLEQTESLEFFMDTIGNVYKVIKHGQATEEPLIYKVSWHDTEIDDRFISLNNITEEILEKYLQLPNIPIEIRKLATDLEDSSYGVLDQIFADVQFLRTNFVYDDQRSKYLYERITQGSDISSYIEQRRGVCIDAATALAIILRIQGIPARISIGYKPKGMEDGKLLYYTAGAHALTEAYLPPYGWIQFDATPPLEESPLVKVSPFKKESSPGSKLFYQLSITNRRNLTDNFKMSVDNRQKWNIEAAPEKLRIEALQTADALLEVTIPDDIRFGEKDVVTITVASLKTPEIAFSIRVITQVENIPHISTTTTLRTEDEVVIRGDTFWINGTVLTTSEEQVDNMTVFVFLTKTRKAEGMIIGKGYSTQGNFQIESAVPYFVEVGDYKVVCISLGTIEHAPSNSDFIIRTCATTRTELGSEEEFLLGYGAIHGRLLWDNGTGFAQTPISLRTTSLATPSQVWESQNLTFNDGSFRIETTLENPGTYEVEATFSGNEYVLGSNATCVVELKRGVPTIQIFGEDIAVRGEVFNITVTIQYEDIRVWGEPVTVILDNQLLATIETRDKGSYTWPFLVDPEEKLGPHIFTASLKRNNASAVHKVVVKSKTRLTTTVSDVAGGMFLLFSVSLFDDHDLPIQGAEIVVDNYGLSWKTDKNGNLTFLLDPVELWPENLVLTAEFEGSELCLPVATEKEVILETLISLPFLIPLVVPTLAAMGLVYSKHYIGRRQTLRQISGIEVAEEEVIAEEERYRPSEMLPIKIILPDIETQFPNVWGINDKLRIEIVLDNNILDKIQKRETEVFIDEENVASTKLSQQGRGGLSHVFTTKGEHKMQAILPRTSGRRPWNAEIKLHVVEYVEEIIRLYNEFLGKLARYDIHAHGKMTVREIENLILRTGDFDPETLRKVTTCFEKAEYSNHLTGRKDYEIMYLSLKELDINVE
jgi:hypothetical protein